MSPRKAGVMSVYEWPVVPLCEKQLLDIKPEDVLEGGLFRKCDIYRGGGGYDQFARIYEKRFGRSVDPVQFVVQLRGCILNCPYCYVTSDGVWGESFGVSSASMLESYRKTGLDVFHLMGGAPAMYMKHWREVASKAKIFHSDFLLIEGLYLNEDMEDLPGLHAVSFKERHIYRNHHMPLVWRNLEKLMTNGVNFYITFTGVDEFSDEISERFGERVLEDSFVIPIKKYKALEQQG